MFKFRNAPTESQTDGDFLSAYRKKIWSLFGLVCVFVFFPGAIFIFVDGYRSLAAAVMAMLVVFVLNGYSVLSDKAPKIMTAIFALSLTFVVGLVLIQRGVIGVFWTFPAVLFISFLAHGRLAKLYTVVYFAVVTTIIFKTLDLEIATRATTGLVVTILVTNIFVGMIDRLQTQLVDQSRVDPLTGAFNRREMDTILQDAIERKRRTSTPASLLMLDIDEFKSVNDTFGHAVGDRALKDFVSLIHSRARHLDQLFRLGGEEFMLFLPDTPTSGALTVAEELRRLIADTEFVADRAITISIGLTELGHGETIDEWIKRGDDALYLAKHSGRNQVAEAPLSEPVQSSFIPNIQNNIPADLLIG